MLEIVAVRLPVNESGKNTFVNMLSISVFEWLVVLKLAAKCMVKKTLMQENPNILLSQEECLSNYY